MAIPREERMTEAASDRPGMGPAADVTRNPPPFGLSDNWRTLLSPRLFSKLCRTPMMHFTDPTCRRLRLSVILAAMAGIFVTQALSASSVGQRFPSEKTSYVDKVTGFPITVLTTAPHNDSRIYQTHPQWTWDQKYIIFRSTRGSEPDANGRRAQQAFAVNETTGVIIQLTEDAGTNPGSINLSRKEDKMWYTKRVDGETQFIEMDLARLFADSEAGVSTSKSQSDYERVIASLPGGLSGSGGFGVDVNEDFAYVGVNRDGEEPQVSAPENQHWRITQTPGGLRRLDLQTGEWSMIIDVPFKMGHVQASPFVPGEIVYCHETGGDALQRMWTVQADGSGNRPLYEENPDDWVTHEIVIGPDEVAFNLIGHMPRLRKNATGIAVINLRTDAVTLYGQIDEEVPEGMLGGGGPGGYWHCNGSHDGRWLAGDTFNGDVYLIDRSSGEQILLTTDHKMAPDHVHPYFSLDGKRVLIQSGHLSGGEYLDLMVVTIPQYLQNRR